VRHTSASRHQLPSLSRLVVAYSSSSSSSREMGEASRKRFRSKIECLCVPCRSHTSNKPGDGSARVPRVPRLVEEDVFISSGTISEGTLVSTRVAVSSVVEYRAALPAPFNSPSSVFRAPATPRLIDIPARRPARSPFHEGRRRMDLHSPRRGELSIFNPLEDSHVPRPEVISACSRTHDRIRVYPRFVRVSSADPS